MTGRRSILAVSLGLILLASTVLVGAVALAGGEAPARAEIATAAPIAPVVAPPQPVMPDVAATLRSGVVIVVSKPSQRMVVFKDGAPWSSSPVSTGKRGHTTPAGVFPILQKKVFHRSNKYSNAPMPYMQRLTWSGIAMHAGHLPGYPASHGCIRLPRSFAKSLYRLTRFGDTTVVISNAPIRTSGDAHRLAQAEAARMPATMLAARELPSAVPVAARAPVLGYASVAGPIETIQLAAAPTAEQAATHWDSLVAARPRLATMQRHIVLATVNARQVYRLRASASGAHALCGQLKNSGIDCFRVT